jgi:histidinol phosphatase-like enzyme
MLNQAGEFLMYKAVFLDRDGTLNFDNFDYIKKLN